MVQSPDPSAQAAAEPAPAPAVDPIQPPEPTPVPEKRAWHLKATTVRKFLVAAVAAIAIAVTQGLIEGTAAKWAAVILGFASAVGVYRLPNDKSAQTETTGA
jgi:hypothetical protein